MTKTSKQNQQELPFILEGNTASRSFIRDHKETITDTDGLYKVDLSIIRIRPGFNPRQKPDGLLEELWEQILHIPELADGIYENNGPLDPLIGDIYVVDGSFVLTEGERRYRAIRHLIATGREKYPNGLAVGSVRILLNAKGTTDKERKRIAVNSANKMTLTVMQRARYYQTFVDDEKMTHGEIADFLKSVSRQTVDNYILCLSLPVETQEKLDSGETTISAAMAALRESKKPTGTQVVVDGETGEILTAGEEYCKKEEEKEKEKLRGDEGEFEQQDNSVPGVSSKGGPKTDSSEAHVIGKDAIYMDTQKLALWKQFVHRYEKVKMDVLMIGDEDLVWEDEVAKRLKDEYNLTVKWQLLP